MLFQPLNDARGKLLFGVSCQTSHFLHAKHELSTQAKKPPLAVKPVPEAEHFADSRGHGNVQASDGAVAHFVGFGFRL